MREKQITITQEELDALVQKEFDKKRRMLFDMGFEGYEPDLHYKVRNFLGKRFITIDGTSWDRLQKRLTKLSDDLIDAREILEITEPFYKRYRVFHEEDVKRDYPFHSFDEYIRMIEAEYTSDEFERVREQFEKEYQIDDTTR